MTVTANGSVRETVLGTEHAQGESQPLAGAPKLFIIALRCGRLANRLVLFANFLALAAEQGHRLINFTFHSYARLFRTTCRDLYCQYPIPKHRSWLDTIPGVADALRKTRLCYHVVRAASRLNERLPIFGRNTLTLREAPGVRITPLERPDIQAQIQPARTIFVYGWNFRAPGCVRRQAEIIRDYFRPLAEHEQAGRDAVDRLRREADVVVGVHVRRGDYQGWRAGQCFFPLSRYADWMRELAAQFPACRVSFLVCSDEPRDAREFPGLSVGLGPGYPVGDLYALAECDYLLGPLSTFSQWASFYGNKPLFHLDNINARVERERFCVSYLGEIP